MAGKLGSDFNVNSPTDNDPVRYGAQAIQQVKSRLVAWAGVLFNLDTGDLRDGVVDGAKLKDRVPSPAGTWNSVTVNAKGLVTAGASVTPDASAFFPTGGVLWMPVAAIPAGYLLCDGRAVSRTTYANLFAVIGAQFGAGDGSTTFNLPALRDRFLFGASGTHVIGERAGAENVTLTAEQMPAHTHTFPLYGGDATNNSADKINTTDEVVQTAAAFETSSAGGGQAHSNMPPFQAGNWLIKT